MNTKELRDGYLALRDLFAKSGPTVKYEVLEEELASRLKMFRTRVKFEKAQEELGFDSRIFGDEPLTDKDRENIEDAGQFKRQITLMENLYWSRKEGYVGGGNMDIATFLRAFEELKEDLLANGIIDSWEVRREDLCDELKVQKDKLRAEHLCRETGLVIESFDIGMPYTDEHRESIRRAEKINKEIRWLEKKYSPKEN